MLQSHACIVCATNNLARYLRWRWRSFSLSLHRALYYIPTTRKENWKRKSKRNDTSLFVFFFLSFLSRMSFFLLRLFFVVIIFYENKRKKKQISEVVSSFYVVYAESDELEICNKALVEEFFFFLRKSFRLFYFVSFDWKSLLF